LTKLAEGKFDLVLLDVTMPVLDGPGMLAKMREGGDKTPVIMLTSESKRSIVSGAMKLGINDYILKPFKPEELRAKIQAVVGAGADEPVTAAVAASIVSPSASATHAPAPSDSSGVAGKFIDIMLIDDMENVPKKLRATVPAHISMNSFTSAQAALAVCREKVFRVILVDSELPEVASGVLSRQLKLLQPHSAVLAMPLRSANDVAAELKKDGFDDVLFKPFTQDSVEDFLIKYFDNQEILVCDDNVLKVGRFAGKDDRLDHYLNRLTDLFLEAIKKVASACYDDVIVDLTNAPARQERLPRVLVAFAENAKQAGLELKLVGTPETTKILATFTETKSVPLYGSVQEARNSAAA
jgi:DNA-binding response OmpR family regulator/anti-anti-sigma regulatory factor